MIFFGKDGVLAELPKALAERSLSTELDAHLTDERADPPPEGQNQPPNRRHGSSPKTVTKDNGKVILDIPRDHNGSFDPVLIAKYQRRFQEFDTKIISMYPRGMTIQESEPLKAPLVQAQWRTGILRRFTALRLRRA